MTTIRTLVVELRASELTPADLLARVDEQFGHEHVAYRYLGNLMLGKDHSATGGRAFHPETLATVYESEPGLRRLVSLRLNDTGNSCTGELFRFTDGTFELVDRVETAADAPPLAGSRSGLLRLDSFGDRSIHEDRIGPEEDRAVSTRHAALLHRDQPAPVEPPVDAEL